MGMKILQQATTNQGQTMPCVSLKWFIAATICRKKESLFCWYGFTDDNDDDDDVIIVNDEEASE